MTEFLASLSSEDLAGLVCGLCAVTVAAVYLALERQIHNLIACIYCEFRQCKPRTTRCYFWDCPVWTNCPYNATPPNKKQSFKEWLQSWRKKGGDAE